MAKEKDKKEKKNSKEGEVQYDNRLDKPEIMDVRWMTNNELDLLFFLFSKVLDRGTETITIPIDELMKATNTPRHKQNYRTWLIHETDKILEFKVRYDYPDGSFRKHDLFPDCYFNQSNDTLEVGINDKFVSCFTMEEWKHFTRFDLKTFVSLKTTYPKHAYRLLKSWKTKGHKEYTVEKFKEELGIPEKYSPAEITRKVLKPIEKEFAEVHAFENFEIKTQTVGRKIIGYQFSWKPENPKQDVINNRKLLTLEKERKARQDAGNPNDMFMCAYERGIRFPDVEYDLFKEKYLRVLKEKGSIDNETIDRISDEIKAERKEESASDELNSMDDDGTFDLDSVIHIEPDTW